MCVCVYVCVCVCVCVVVVVVVVVVLLLGCFFIINLTSLYLKVQLSKINSFRIMLFCISN